jgi:hypothetical protein
MSTQLGDKAGGLLRFGITTPFRFVAKPPKEMSRSPDIIQNPSASYVLLVDGIDAISCDLNFDWSRHLPPEVPLNRKEHDKYVLQHSPDIGSTWSKDTRSFLQVLQHLLSPRYPFLLSQRHVPRIEFACIALPP